MQNSLENLSSIRELLKLTALEPSRRDPAWLDSPIGANGFIRFVINEDDGALECYRFDARTLLK